MCEANRYLPSSFNKPIKKVRYDNSGQSKEIYYRETDGIYQKTDKIDFNDVSKTNWKDITKIEYELTCKNNNISSNNYTKKCLGRSYIDGEEIEGELIYIDQNEFNNA